MSFHERGGLRYYTFPAFEAAGVRHAVLTRRGGASRAPFESLNMGSSVGDDPVAVAENRRRAFALFGRAGESVPELHQVHSTRVLLGTRRREGEPPPQADGVVTDDPRLTLCMRFADCVPILLYDPAHRAAGMAHAGWKGTIAGVAASAVEAMRAHFGSKPEDILAGIGPSIGPDHYIVGEEVLDALHASFGEKAADWLVGSGSETRLNLWEINRETLQRAGVTRIELAGICTACHTEDWFSHRAERGKTGRFAALLWVEE